MVSSNKIERQLLF